MTDVRSIFGRTPAVGRQHALVGEAPAAQTKSLPPIIEYPVLVVSLSFEGPTIEWPVTVSADARAVSRKRLCSVFSGLPVDEDGKCLAHAIKNVFH
ncbi:hypothetical protein M8A51_18685 [Schlegelella sp. S2-27]|uniref:Uncharacterized protein n=1 Tax=Caldimonas mangrovi TaxID=2944811 RepID=A0ABT0YTX7_9BURK|nr:hypothetical protein [Caldimonas mangrovi]MCM5681556.1 hypothetical protein [Caldimonas mangrovi]